MTDDAGAMAAPVETNTESSIADAEDDRRFLETIADPAKRWPLSIHQ